MDAVPGLPARTFSTPCPIASHDVTKQNNGSATSGANSHLHEALVVVLFFVCGLNHNYIVGFWKFQPIFYCQGIFFFLYLLHLLFSLSFARSKRAQS